MGGLDKVRVSNGRFRVAEEGKEMGIGDAAVREVLTGLRDSGHAVVVFTPEELNNARPNRAEDQMVSAGWDFIESWPGNADEEAG